MKKDEQTPNLVFLSCVTTMMHGAFITQQMQLKILHRITDILSGFKEASEVQSAVIADIQS